MGGIADSNYQVSDDATKPRMLVATFLEKKDAQRAVAAMAFVSEFLAWSDAGAELFSYAPTEETLTDDPGWQWLIKRARKAASS